MIKRKKKINVKVIYFSWILVFYSLVFCGSKEIQTLNNIKKLKNDNPDIKKEAIFELHKACKESVPFLIDEISDTTKILCQLQNPKYSFYGEPHTYFGVLSAFVIELILGRENLEKESFFKTQFLLGSEESNYIFTQGVIFNEHNKMIEEKDLNEIKNIYETWWEKNKHKSIETLRIEWKKNIRPLQGSKYYWK